jgi:hypothetical protein
MLEKSRISGRPKHSWEEDTKTDLNKPGKIRTRIDVTERRVRETIVTAGKKEVLHIPSVCL